MPVPEVSILIPAYNEAATIEEVLHKVLNLGIDAEILVIDDGSTDRTADITEDVSAHHGAVSLLRLDTNRGKGSAVRFGISHSRGRFVIIQDADLEYDPADIPKLLDPMRRGVADAVFGSRLRGGEPQRAHMFWHYAGNRFLSLFTNVLYNTTISDMEVGYKAFRGDLVRSLHLVSNTFTIEPEITAKILRTPGIRLYEVPISYFGRTYDEGKKITWRDGLKAVLALLRFRFGTSGAPISLDDPALGPVSGTPGGKAETVAEHVSR